ncbi:protein FAR1-RELATED SEQUENCE 5-like [Tripterygium wilfordii]|uniref:protein FAR1-RELATED SEQUENCE 5-like n=1 Tax=Tripterygium wilfordii TaxID=458696 RepID=UPI0018F84696|nr:protein FAR1-RELATED SEQUENCE 5-like [Tripterygium wilfordii]
MVHINFGKLTQKRLVLVLEKSTTTKIEKQELLLVNCLCVARRGKKRKKKDDDDMIRHHSSTKTDCKARLKVFLDKHRAKYIVNEFVEQHNHELQPPTTIHMLRSHREVITAHALAIELASDSGLTPKVTQELMSREAGGGAKLGFFIEDQKSYLRSRRERNIGSGELGSIFSSIQRGVWFCRFIYSEGVHTRPICIYCFSILENGETI